MHIYSRFSHSIQTPTLSLSKYALDNLYFNSVSTTCSVRSTSPSAGTYSSHMTYSPALIGISAYGVSFDVLLETSNICSTQLHREIEFAVQALWQSGGYLPRFLYPYISFLAWGKCFCAACLLSKLWFVSLQFLRTYIHCSHRLVRGR